MQLSSLQFSHMCHTWETIVGQVNYGTLPLSLPEVNSQSILCNYNLTSLRLKRFTFIFSSCRSIERSMNLSRRYTEYTETEQCPLHWPLVAILLSPFSPSSSSSFLTMHTLFTLRVDQMTAKVTAKWVDRWNWKLQQQRHSHPPQKTFLHFHATLTCVSRGDKKRGMLAVMHLSERERGREEQSLPGNCNVNLATKWNCSPVHACSASEYWRNKWSHGFAFSSSSMYRWRFSERWGNETKNTHPFSRVYRCTCDVTFLLLVWLTSHSTINTYILF